LLAIWELVSGQFCSAKTKRTPCWRNDEWGYIWKSAPFGNS